MEYNIPGKRARGLYEPGSKIIYLGSGSDDPAALSHEVGHAIAGLEESQIPKEYGACVDRFLLFEGTAILNNIIVREEIFATGGRDIGITGVIAVYMEKPFMNTYTDFKNGIIAREKTKRKFRPE